MRRLLRLIATGLWLALFAIPASAQFNAGAPWGKDTLPGVTIWSADRTVVYEDVAHYRYRVQVGAGPFDMVQVHRVVREAEPWKPKRTAEGAFLLPGLPQFFEAIFMPPNVSDAAADDHSFAIYLAQNGIDVWGMDWGWDFVPGNATDFDFMAGWGVAKDAMHTEFAMSIARRIRTLTGQGNGRLHLLGFSYGVHVAYAVANSETQRPPGHRNVKGLIPVDNNFKVSAEGPRLNNCANAVAVKNNFLDQGIFQEQWPFKFIGYLALNDPDGPSPIIGGLTNYDAALTLGIAGSFVTGTFGPPAALTFTDDRLFVDLIAGTPDFSTRQSAYDLYAVRCDDDVIAPVSIDDHLAKISLPIFYVGKNAAHGLYAATRTASTDISQLLVNPPAYPNLAHADLFLAPAAEDLVWFPILQWMLAHKENPSPF